MNTIVTATAGHVREMLGMMRDQDERECQLSHGVSADVGLVSSFEHSELAWTILHDDKAVCMLGVCPASPKIGVPWLLATKEFKDCERYLLRVSMDCVRQAQERFPLLVNYVWEKNRRSIKWLRWCGFDVSDPVPFGVAGEKFHPFVRLQECV